MDTIETIKKRRSVRKFKQDKISHELIETMIEAAVYAPSWKNTQITRYIAIENEEIKNKIAIEYVPEFNQKSILSAPVLMAVTVMKGRSGFERDGSFTTKKGNGWEMFDCGIASQTFCLAASEYGLGTVILGIFDIEGITELLGIPEEQELVALIPLGYPDESPNAPKRKEIQDVLKYI